MAAGEDANGAVLDLLNHAGGNERVERSFLARSKKLKPLLPMVGRELSYANAAASNHDGRWCIQTAYTNTWYFRPG